MQTDLSIVIVSWNTRELLRNSLRSVFDNGADLSLEVFVVDNASTDGSVAMIRESFPLVRVIENKSNVGFAAANNQAFPFCSAELVLLLNSDTIIIGQALKILVDFMREHPEAGGIGPRLLHPRLKLRVLGCGYQPTLWREFTHQFGLSRLFPHSRLFRGVHLFIRVHDTEALEVEWISGAALLVRAEVIKKVGGLSERWFMYAEDMEWCQRILQAGWKLFSVPQGIVEHHLSASTTQREDAALISVTAGRSYFIHSQKPSRLKMLLFDLVSISGNLLRATVFFVRSVTDAHHARMWRSRARLFARYARVHALLCCGLQRGRV
jgi:N-acetylglucosaminyl-diphospho-decaprenol L-rhamnosyltransferase